MVRGTAAISDKRFGDLIKKPNVKPIEDSKDLQVGEILIKNCGFTWNMQSEKEDEEKEDIFKLEIEEPLSIKNGEFIGVYGKIGSGKSSLLLSILGELNQTSTKPSGTNKKNGSIAYIS